MSTTPQRIQILHSQLSKSSQPQSHQLQQSLQKIQGTQWNTPNKQQNCINNSSSNNNNNNNSINNNSNNGKGYNNQLLNSQQQQQQQKHQQLNNYAVKSTCNYNYSSAQQNKVNNPIYQMSVPQQTQTRSNTQRSNSQSHCLSNMEYNVSNTDEIINNSGDLSPAHKPCCWTLQKQIQSKSNKNSLQNSPNQNRVSNQNESPILIRSQPNMNHFKPTQTLMMPATKSSHPTLSNIVSQQGNTPPKINQLLKDNNSFNTPGNNYSTLKQQQQVQQPSTNASIEQLKNEMIIKNQYSQQQATNVNQLQYNQYNNSIQNSHRINSNSQLSTMLSQKNNQSNSSLGIMSSSNNTNQLPPHPQHHYLSQQNININTSQQSNLCQSNNNNNNNRSIINQNYQQDLNMAKVNPNSFSLWLNGNENQERKIVYTQEEAYKEIEYLQGVIKNLVEERGELKQDYNSVNQELLQLKMRTEEEKAQEITMFKVNKRKLIPFYKSIKSLIIKKHLKFYQQQQDDTLSQKDIQKLQYLLEEDVEKKSSIYQSLESLKLLCIQKEQEIHQLKKILEEGIIKNMGQEKEQQSNKLANQNIILQNQLQEIKQSYIKSEDQRLLLQAEKDKLSIQLQKQYQDNKIGSTGSLSIQKRGSVQTLQESQSSREDLPQRIQNQEQIQENNSQESKCQLQIMIQEQHIQIDNFRKDNMSIKKKYSQLEHSYEDISRKLKEAQSNIQAKSQECENWKNKYADGDKINETIPQLQIELNRREQTIQELNVIIEQINNANRQYKLKIGEKFGVENKINEKQMEIEQMIMQLSEQKKQMQELQTNVLELKNVDKTKEVLQKQYKLSHDENNQLKNTIQDNLDTISALENIIEANKQQMDISYKDNQQLINNIRQLQQQNILIQEELQNTVQEKKQILGENKMLSESLISLNASISELQNEIKFKQEQINVLTYDNQMMVNELKKVKQESEKIKQDKINAFYEIDQQKLNNENEKLKIDKYDQQLNQQLQLINELENVNQSRQMEIQQQMKIISELENTLKSLTDEMMEMQAHIDRCKQREIEFQNVIESQNNEFEIKINDIRTQINELNTANLKKEYERHIEQVNQINKKLEIKEQQLKEIDQKYQIKLQEIEKVINLNEEFENKLKDSSVEIIDLKQQNSSLKKEYQQQIHKITIKNESAIKKEQEKQQEIQEQLRGVLLDRQILEQKHSAKLSQIQRLEEQLSKAQEIQQYLTQQNQLSSMNSEFETIHLMKSEALQKQINEKNNIIKSLDDEKVNYLQEISRMQKLQEDTYHSQQKIISNIKQEMISKDQEIERQVNQINQLKKYKQDSESDKYQWQISKSKIENQLDVLQRQYNELERAYKEQQQLLYQRQTEQQQIDQDLERVKKENRDYQRHLKQFENQLEQLSLEIKLMQNQKVDDEVIKKNLQERLIQQEEETSQQNKIFIESLQNLQALKDSFQSKKNESNNLISKLIAQFQTNLSNK